MSGFGIRLMCWSFLCLLAQFPVNPFLHLVCSDSTRSEARGTLEAHRFKLEAFGLAPSMSLPVNPKPLNPTVEG